MESSIADLIDNSISAGSRNVWLDFRWAGSTSIAIIADDGCGMSEAGLVEAMRPGTEGPCYSRSARPRPVWLGLEDGFLVSVPPVHSSNKAARRGCSVRCAHGIWISWRP
ncbi:MAG: ATP-binding protein [Gemmatimonadetes bacterium]|nr:ATP-binding protein [Gemmatimonadota bacterium]